MNRAYLGLVVFAVLSSEQKRSQTLRGRSGEGEGERDNSRSPSLV